MSTCFATHACPVQNQAYVQLQTTAPWYKCTNSGHLCFRPVVLISAVLTPNNIYTNDTIDATNWALSLCRSSCTIQRRNDNACWSEAKILIYTTCMHAHAMYTLTFEDCIVIGPAYYNNHTIKSAISVLCQFPLMKGSGLGQNVWNLFNLLVRLVWFLDCCM